MGSTQGDRGDHKGKSAEAFHTHEVERLYCGTGEPRQGVFIKIPVSTMWSGWGMGTQRAN